MQWDLAVASERFVFADMPFTDLETDMPKAELETIAKAMVAPGRGILAADESTGTIERRFKSINVENTEENRRAYRDLLFSAKSVGQYISGAILYDETLRQKAADGTPFPQLLDKQGVIAGIKVDAGAKDMALCPAYAGAICSLCCTLESRCHDTCKTDSRAAEQLGRIIDLHLPPRIAAALRTRAARFAGAMLLHIPPDVAEKVPFEIEPLVRLAWLLGLLPFLSGIGRIIAALAIRPPMHPPFREEVAIDRGLNEPFPPSSVTESPTPTLERPVGQASPVPRAKHKA